MELAFPFPGQPRSCAARKLDRIVGLGVSQRGWRGDGWLTRCCSRSSACCCAGPLAWLSWCSGGAGRRTPNCWYSGTRTWCCAGTPAGCDMTPRIGPGSPRSRGSSRAGAGRRSSPSRLRRCWPGTAGLPPGNTTRANGANRAAQRRSGASPGSPSAWRRRSRSGVTAVVRAGTAARLARPGAARGRCPRRAGSRAGSSSHPATADQPRRARIRRRQVLSGLTHEYQIAA